MIVDIHKLHYKPEPRIADVDTALLLLFPLTKHNHG